MTRKTIGSTRGEPKGSTVQRNLAQARQSAKAANNQAVAAAHERKAGPAPKVPAGLRQAVPAARAGEAQVTEIQYFGEATGWRDCQAPVFVLQRRE